MSLDNRIYSGCEKANRLLDFGFQRFDTTTIPLYTSYLNQMNGPTGSFMRVSNIITWSTYSIPYYKECDGFILIVNDDAYTKNFSVFMPIGDYSNTSGLRSCFQFIESVYAVLEEPIDYLQGKEWMLSYLIDFNCDYRFDDSESDYLYPLSDLKRSMERRSVHYDKKIENFLEQYNPTIQEYEESDYKTCVEIIKARHCMQDGCKGCVYGCILKWFILLVSNLDVLKATIYTIKSNGKIIAFITMVDDEDLLYFDRKADGGFNGLSEYINDFIVSKYLHQYSIMNFEEDMGSNGLRRHKKALGPYILSRNYHVKVGKLNEEE